MAGQQQQRVHFEQGRVEEQLTGGRAIRWVHAQTAFDEILNW